MTRIIRSGPRHYFVRTDTFSAWRPQPGQYARLVSVAEGPQQAAVGDVVEVTRTITPPTGFHNDEEGVLWLEHRGGSNCRCATLDTPRGEKLNHGTVGIWEHVVPVVLATWPDGTTLERLSGEDRVAVLVAAVAELTEGERAEVSRLLKEGLGE